jgi:hypothetical protein
MSLGSCCGHGGSSRCIAGRCILKPREHPPTDEEQDEQDDPDEETDALASSLGRRRRWCKWRHLVRLIRVWIGR